MDESNHIWFRSLERELARLTLGVGAARVLLSAMHGESDMGKLAELGSRIREMRALQDREADAIFAKVVKIEQEAPEAFARTHNFLDATRADVSKLEDELMQLTNGLPPSES